MYCPVLSCIPFLFWYGQGDHLDLILTSSMGFEHHPLRTKKLIAAPWLTGVVSTVLTCKERKSTVADGQLPRAQGGSPRQKFAQ